MEIELIGEIHPELKRLGLEAGDKVQASPCPVSKVGVMHFMVSCAGIAQTCSVWPENYKIVEPKTNK